MALDQTQRTTLLAAVKLDGTANGYRTGGDAFSLLAWCNAPSATSAWRTAVTGGEVYDAHKPTDYIARTAQERDAFNLMASMSRVHDFTVNAKRNGVADIFSGASNSTSRANIFAIAQEFATNAQLALGGSQAATGGNATMAETVTALRRNFAGQVDGPDVNWLINAP